MEVKALCPETGHGPRSAPQDCHRGSDRRALHLRPVDAEHREYDRRVSREPMRLTSFLRYPHKMPGMTPPFGETAIPSEVRDGA